MLVRFRPTIAIACVALTLTCIGCSGNGFESPEACFKSIRTAAHNKDMGALAKCLDEESQNAMAGMLVMVGSMMKAPGSMAAMMSGGKPEDAQKGIDAIEAAFKKHGLTDELLQKEMAAMQSAGGAEGVTHLSTLVKDKPAFIADMYAAMQQLGGAAKFGEQFEEQIAGELKDVKIDGDKASAVVVTAKGEEPLAFRKTAAGWKLHIELNQMGPAGAGAAPPA